MKLIITHLWPVYGPPSPLYKLQQKYTKNMRRKQAKMRNERVNKSSPKDRKRKRGGAEQPRNSQKHKEGPYHGDPIRVSQLFLRCPTKMKGTVIVNMRKRE